MANEPYRDSIHIESDPDDVFDYFTQPEALVQWMGDRAVLEPVPGGEFTLYFDDRCVRGRYVEVDRPRRLVITWGREGSRDMPPFSSTLEITLAAETGGTRVTIVHDGLPTSEAPRHALRWHHYLERLRVVGGGGAVAPHHTPRELTDGVVDR